MSFRCRIGVAHWIVQNYPRRQETNPGGYSRATIRPMLSTNNKSIKYCRQPSFIKPLMAEQQRHVSDGRNWTHVTGPCFRRSPTKLKGRKCSITNIELILLHAASKLYCTSRLWIDLVTFFVSGNSALVLSKLNSTYISQQFAWCSTLINKQIWK